MPEDAADGRNGLRQDQFVEEVMPDPSDPAPPMVVFAGLLGKSTTDGSWRLYFTEELDLYIEFKEDDVLKTKQIPGEHSGLGFESTKVWMRSDATTEINFRTQSLQVSSLLTQGLINILTGFRHR